VRRAGVAATQAGPFFPFANSNRITSTTGADLWAAAESGCVLFWQPALKVKGFNMRWMLSVCLATIVWIGAQSSAEAGAFANKVLDYSAGTGVSAAFTQSQAALGSPERFTGEGSFPSVVSPFSPPFLPDEIVSIGETGFLTLRLSNFAVAQAAGPEIGIFGNVGFIDTSYPNGQAGNPVGTFGIDSVNVEVSADGLSWVSLGLVTPNIPTNGYTDLTDPFSGTPGTALSDFGLPFTGTLADFNGLPYSNASDPHMLELLGGSGGGTWIDISASGLAQVGFVRFSVASDGVPTSRLKFDLDAVSVANSAVGLAVPEPATWLLAVVGLVGLLAGRWRKAARGGAMALALVVLASTSSTASAGTILTETFDTDPVAGGRASIVGSDTRFDYAAGTVTAHYDSGLATAKMAWDLGRTIDGSLPFSFDVEFTIKSQNLFASPNAFAQIAFGLENSSTTGLDRAGGAGGNAFDVVGVDYFPNVSPLFGGPVLGPAIVQSNNGTGFFGRIAFPFGEESGLDDEGSLPLDVKLLAQGSFDPLTSILKLRMSGPNGPLDINSVGDVGFPGGLDGEDDTIEVQLPLGGSFSVDRFALQLWQDTFAGGTTGTRADVVFDSISVAVVPEPASILLAAIGGALLVVARRRSR
jgi:hypothetical protein